MLLSRHVYSSWYLRHVCAMVPAFHFAEVFYELFCY